MFQFNSQTACITYSNVEQQSTRANEIHPIYPFKLEQEPILDRSTIRQFFRSGNIGENLQYLCIASEQHKTGQWHFHVAAKWSTPFRSRNERVFDIGRIHPNVQSARKFSAWVKYVKKDGDYIEEGYYEDNKPTEKEIIERAKSMDKLQFLAYMSVNKLHYASQIWEMAHPDLTHTITAEMVFNTIDRCDPVIIKAFITDTWDDTKVLVLWGDTGLGKTSMAKILVPKPALMVSHLDDLKKFRAEYHKGIIFDDVSIQHLPETAQIHLLDYLDTRSIHVRYGTVTIPKNTPKIFTCNNFPVSDIPAIRRRIQSVRITKFIKDL